LYGKSKSDSHRNIIFTDAVTQTLIKNPSIPKLLKIQKIGAIYNLSSKELDNALLQLNEQEKLTEPKKDAISNI
jgi:hypothetical protein